MENSLKQKALCEACGKKEAISFSLFKGGDWRFTCECTAEVELYYIYLQDYFASSKSVVDWNAHLYGKSWMDTNAFFAMMHRFRAATGSFFA